WQTGCRAALRQSDDRESISYSKGWGARSCYRTLANDVGSDATQRFELKSVILQFAHNAVDHRGATLKGFFLALLFELFARAQLLGAAVVVFCGPSQPPLGFVAELNKLGNRGGNLHSRWIPQSGLVTVSMILSS